jgi:glycosyltransferase involved in cell wall biosynthesis
MHFAGNRTDVPRLMRGGMDVFVFPSLFEGFGLTLLEAQAAGLHCLVSTSVPDEIVVSKDSVDFVALAEGASYWATRAIQCLDAPRPSASSTIEMMSQSQFAIEQSLRKLTNIYGLREESEAVLVVRQHA